MNSGVRLAAGPAGAVYERAGFHPDHGVAFQEVADATERIIVSRCAAPVAIQLLDEDYSSKGFGIKAKSCDWGPFAGFAMSHVQYGKLAFGRARKGYEKQENFFRHGASDTGFAATDQGGENAVAPHPRHSSLAQEQVLALTRKRLEYLQRERYVRLLYGLVDNGKIVCDRTPFGPLEFILKDLHTGSEATWGIKHRDGFAIKKGQVRNRQDKSIEWTLVKAMANTAADAVAADPHKRCCAGDYDLWGVFPKRNSASKNTASLAKHGMERQLARHSALNPNLNRNRNARARNDSAQMREEMKIRSGGQSIGDRVKAFRKSVDSTREVREHPQYGKYKEDREKGNISALTLHTARALNKAIRDKGFRGGNMVHHNDDLGNPFRNDIEDDLIAFVPGQPAEFITSDTAGRGAGGHVGWKIWVDQYRSTYFVYDNPAIWHSAVRG